MNNESDGPPVWGWESEGNQSDEQLPYDPNAVDAAFLRPADESIMLGDTYKTHGDDPIAIEPIPGPAGEIHAICMQEVEFAIETAESAARAGDQPDDDIRRILAEQTIQAAKNNDIGQIDRSVAIFASYPEMTMPSLDGLHTAMLTGDDRAATLLHEVLTNERAARPEKIAADIATDTEAGHYALNSPVLSSVVYACRTHDTDAQPWIDTYALDQQDNWQLSTNYYAALLREAADGEDNGYKAQLNAKAAELTEDGAFTPQFIRDNTRMALRHATDPAVSAGVLATYKRVLDGTSAFRWTDFQELMMVSGTVLEDETLATPANVEYFADRIDQLAALFREGGVDAYDIINNRMLWDISLARHNGATSEDIVDTVDLLVGSMMASDIPEQPDGTAAGMLRNRAAAPTIRDRWLGVYAHDAVQKGDVEGAAYYLSVISTQSVKAGTLQKSLEHIQTPEQLQVITPTDELTFAFDPSLAVQFAFAEARLTGDIATLRELALYRVPAMLYDRSSVPRKQVKSAYEAIAAIDPAQAVSLAREILPMLRAIDASSYDTEYLSAALIAAGDQDEPLQAYEEIGQTHYRQDSRLIALWELAKKIEAAHTPGSL